MLLTSEDLLAISQVLDERLDKKLNERLKPIEDDIRELKKDVAALKTDVATLKTDVATLKTDVATLKTNVASLEAGLHNVKLFQENVILPRLNTIESCYLDTYRRYQKNCDKMDVAFDDIALLKNVAADHSIKLQKLALA